MDGTRRMRVAITTLAVLGLIPISSRAGACASRSAAAVTAIRYETDAQDNGGEEIPAALTAMLFPVEGFSLVGVSPDHRIIGFNSTDAFGEVVMLVDQGMRASGWTALPSSERGVMSFGHTGGWDDERISSDTALVRTGYALIIVQDLGDSVSVLVQLA